MNAALKICQERYDAQLPPDISEANPEQEWLEHSAEQLVCGMDIKWKRRFGRPQVVTFDRYCTYLQGILNQRQIDGLDERDLAGQRFAGEISRCAHAAGQFHLARSALVQQHRQDLPRRAVAE